MIKIRRHLQWLERLHIVPFTLLMAVYAFVGRLVVALPLAIAILITGEDVFVIPDREYPVAAVLILAPLVETIIGQWLPITVASRFTQRNSVQILVSTALFSALHVEPISVIAAVPPAIVLAYAFIVHRRRGTWQALFATAMVHFWINLAAMWLKRL
ncbi:MAG TPA: CPBP family intramembrane metalloprotease [Firmicutes bacterium]|nr:CPBP family intramembrane metalloprotease [Candidatus Fermentithermobacillaceae bacterium]